MTAFCRIYSQSPDATGIISKSFHSQFFLFLVEFLRFYAMLSFGWVDNQERFTKHMSLSALEFAIFCIEEIALKLQIPGSAVYDMLSKRSDILSSYIIPSYDVLHTQSKEYIVDDIIALMREEGVLA